MEFAQEGGEGPRPTRCCCTPRSSGDSTYFTRQDIVEETWRVVAAAARPRPARSQHTSRGVWGPGEADELVEGYGGWRGPWVTE